MAHPQKQSQKKKQAPAIASPAFTVCPCKNVQSNRATNTNIASYRNYICRTTEPCLQFFRLEIHQARYFLRDHWRCCSSKKNPRNLSEMSNNMDVCENGRRESGNGSLAAMMNHMGCGGKLFSEQGPSHHTKDCLPRKI